MSMYEIARRAAKLRDEIKYLNKSMAYAAKRGVKVDMSVMTITPIDGLPYPQLEVQLYAEINTDE